MLDKNVSFQKTFEKSDCWTSLQTLVSVQSFNLPINEHKYNTNGFQTCFMIGEYPQL